MKYFVFIQTNFAESPITKKRNFERMPPPLTMGHMSCVTYHVLRIRCQVSFFLKGQSGGASRWRVCYKQSLLCQVFNNVTFNNIKQLDI